MSVNKKFRFLVKNEHGNVLLLVGLAFLILVGFAGLVIDGGLLYAERAHLQKTANAAALSGAQELTNSKQQVEQVVQETLAGHAEADSLDDIQIVDDRMVRVYLTREVPLHFFKIFGFQSTPVKVYAAAELMSMGRAIGAAPVGIEESIELEYGVEYTLKVDEEDVDTGNFGILALGGPGADIYEDNLTHGYTDEIAVGDILDTQTGNIAGKTRDGVQARIDACPYEPGEMHHRDCPRILLIPIYREHSYKGNSNNQLETVKVVGFAYFYLSEPMNWQDKTIKGQFVERAGTGFYEEGSLDGTGAYAIRLTQ